MTRISSPQAIPDIGLYIWSDTPDQHDFWKACGYTTMQLCDLGWHRNAENGMAEQHTQALANGVKSLQADGFKVYIILFANIKQYKGPEDVEPTGIGEKFHPSDEAEMKERLSYLRKTIEACKSADGFTMFAGDPGGIPDFMGPGQLLDFVNMALKVKALVKEVAPEAEFNINPWCVSMFRTPNHDAMTKEFWLQETVEVKQLLDMEGIFGPETGIELPCHDYYRALTLRLYDEDPVLRADPPLFPLKSDLDGLFDRQTKNVWAWPYFLMDEADDGDIGPGNTPLPQSETRYIHRFVRQARELGFNGIIGNWSYRGYLSKCMNTYAFARFCADDRLTPRQVIEEYAAFVAREDCRSTLVQILLFLENNSNWQRKLPESAHVEDFDTTVQSGKQALELLEAVSPNEANAFPLPESTSQYLQRLKLRLQIIAEQE
ncbi:MAG: hypothetical protein IKD06_06340 [Clostridia bacterium]|nr:hypothetical protein [Clostridia bacterium]